MDPCFLGEFFDRLKRGGRAGLQSAQAHRQRRASWGWFGDIVQQLCKGLLPRLVPPGGAALRPGGDLRQLVEIERARVVQVMKVAIFPVADVFVHGGMVGSHHRLASRQRLEKRHPEPLVGAACFGALIAFGGIFTVP